MKLQPWIVANKVRVFDFLKIITNLMTKKVNGNAIKPDAL